MTATGHYQGQRTLHGRARFESVDLNRDKTLRYKGREGLASGEAEWGGHAGTRTPDLYHVKVAL